MFDVVMDAVQIATLGLLIWYSFTIKRVIDDRTQRFSAIELKIGKLENKVDLLTQEQAKPKGNADPS